MITFILIAILWLVIGIYSSIRTWLLNNDLTVGSAIGMGTLGLLGPIMALVYIIFYLNEKDIFSKVLIHEDYTRKQERELRRTEEMERQRRNHIPEDTFRI